jgi:hypothetical protein
MVTLGAGSVCRAGASDVGVLTYGRKTVNREFSKTGSVIAHQVVDRLGVDNGVAEAKHAPSPLTENGLLTASRAQLSLVNNRTS